MWRAITCCELLIAREAHFPQGWLREELAMSPFILTNTQCVRDEGTPCTLTFKDWRGLIAPPDMAKPSTPQPPQTPSSTHGPLSFSVN